ncbi:MAG: hypothetical protein ABGW98_13715 [Myxococcales bacterium]
MKRVGRLASPSAWWPSEEVLQVAAVDAGRSVDADLARTWLTGSALALCRSGGSASLIEDPV